MTWPTITIDPVKDALRAISEYKKEHQGKRPTHLLCGHDDYCRLCMVVGPYFMSDSEGNRTLDGVILREKSHMHGYLAIEEIRK